LSRLPPLKSRPDVTGVIDNIVLGPAQVAWRAANDGRCPVSHAIDELDAEAIRSRLAAAPCTAALARALASGVGRGGVVRVSLCRARGERTRELRGASLRDCAVALHPFARMRLVIGACVVARVARSTNIVVDLPTSAECAASGLARTLLEKSLADAFTVYAKLHPASASVRVRFLDRDDGDDSAEHDVVSAADAAWIPAVLHGAALAGGNEIVPGAMIAVAGEGVGVPALVETIDADATTLRSVVAEVAPKVDLNDPKRAVDLYCARAATALRLCGGELALALDQPLRHRVSAAGEADIVIA
jgi:hypothetical protein